MRLDNKAAILGDKFNGHNIKPETEGGKEGGDAGEPVPAREFRLTKIMLTQKQFEGLVGEGAFNSFFNQSKNSPLEPAFGSFKTLWLDDTYKGCAVTFSLGNTNTKEIEIKGGAKIKNLSVKFPKACNERACAELACTVQAVFPRNVVTLDMENFIGKEIRVSLRFGPIDESEEAEENKQTDFVEKAKEEGADASPAARKPSGDQPRVN